MVALFNASTPHKTITTEDKHLNGGDRAINVTGLRFSWGLSPAPVLDITSLRIDKGERVFIEGPSGSGKSTLLALLAGILTPQDGHVIVLDHCLEEMGGALRDHFRADHIGFIFQMFNLIPYLTVIENVTLPCRFSRRRREKALCNANSVVAEARRLLAHLDLDHPDLLSRAVTELSVGQQQRVAAARALMGAPELVIADEPTSSLDAGHRRSFIRLLFEECAKAQSTLVFVSHDISLAPLFDRTVRLPEINRAGKDTSGHGSEVR